MNELAFELNGIHKSFGDKTVLRGVDLSVPVGTILGLVGKNGAGKSTLIKCLLGLLKPSAGSAAVFGESAWNLSAQTKQRIGYVQQTMTGFRWMQVETMLDYIGAFYPIWNKEKVRSLISEWDLDPGAKIEKLSEGERQKLSIIQVLGHEPDLFIFDEPVASLDPLARRHLHGSDGDQRVDQRCRSGVRAELSDVLQRCGVIQSLGHSSAPKRYVDPDISCAHYLCRR